MQVFPDGYVAFLLVVALIAVTPGADMALVARQVLLHGRRAGMLTIAGVLTGQVVYGALSAAGLTVLIAQSQVAFNVIRIAGACYLVALGVLGIWSTLRRTPVDALGEGEEAALQEEGAPGRAPLSARRAWLLGCTTTLLNPKVGLLFITFIPQFLVGSEHVGLRAAQMALTIMVVGGSWLAFFAWVVSRASDLMERPRVRRLVERVTGITLVGVGVRVMAAGR